MHACMHAYIRYIHYTNTYKQTYIHTYIHAKTHTYIHTYIHTYTCIYVYIGVDGLVDRVLLGLVGIVEPICRCFHRPNFQGPYRRPGLYISVFLYYKMCSLGLTPTLTHSHTTAGNHGLDHGPSVVDASGQHIFKRCHS